MKTIFLLPALGILTGLFLACSYWARSTSSPDMHNSMNALDWQGVYTGKLPCPDCDGIQSMLRLSPDMSYVLETTYLGKSPEVHRNKGAFRWNEDGNTITLDMQNQPHIPAVFAVLENKIVQYDMNNELSNSAYYLEKDTRDLFEIKWKLTEINGRKIDNPGDMNAEAFIEFKAVDNRVHGNGGCNSFSGGFEIQEENKIHFQPMLATRMYCPSMEVENAMMKMFENADQFQINENELILQSNNTILARFKAN